MIDQILIVKFKGGKIKKFRRALSSDLFDLREKFDIDPSVVDTELQYDI